MNFITSYRKKISFLLIVSILSANFSFFSFPNESYATGIPTFDFANFGATIKQTAWDIAKEAGKKAVAAAYRYAVRELIQKITESTVEWINNGFQGQPAFIANPSKFLTDLGDNIVGDMIAGGPLNFLCSPFQLEVKLALGLGGNSTFTKRIGCTLSNVVNNVQNAKVGASASLTITRKSNTVGTNIQRSSDAVASWNDFIKIVENPQDTPTGAYLIAATELAAQIKDKQNSVTQELNQNAGALNYKKCTETTYDANGNQVGQRTYSGSDFISVSGSATLPVTLNGNTVTNTNTKKTVCKTTTPGRVITDLLASKATENGHINEMQAALGDGLDQIFNALANQLLKKLQNGLLGDNSAVNAEQTSNRVSAAKQVAIQYQQGIASAQSYASGQGVSAAGITQTPDFSPYNSFFGSNYSQSFIPVTETATVSPLAGIDNLAKPRTDAIARLYSLNDSELNYQNTYTTAVDILTQARAIFATSSACNAKYTDPTSQLRAQIINANVVTNIDGTPNSARDVASIPWNLRAIQDLINISNQHIDILGTAQSTILAIPMNAQNTNDITTAMIPVNSTKFNIDPETAVVGYIKTWLTSMQAKYTTPQCPINLSSVLAITIPVFKPTTPPVIVPEGTGIATSLANPTGTATNPNPVSGPFISSISPAGIVAGTENGAKITVNGGQLIWGKLGDTANQNSIILDGAEILTGISGATIQGLSLSFNLPSTLSVGTHTISVKNKYGTTNTVNLKIYNAWIYCAHDWSENQSNRCNFSGTHTVIFYNDNGYKFADGTWLPAGSQNKTGTWTNGVDCNNATFGGDPAPGQGKSCQYWSGAPGTAPIFTP